MPMKQEVLWELENLYMKQNLFYKTLKRQWSFSIVGEDLSLRNVRLPTISDIDSQAHIITNSLTQLLANIIDKLFHEFMSLNTFEFENEITEIRHWIENKVTI